MAQSVKWQWQRVSKSFHCPVCDKADWCSTCPDLGLVLCMRVESSRPSHNIMGGWIHSIGTDRQPPKTIDSPEPPQIDAEAIMQRLLAKHWPSLEKEFAQSLGVAWDVLAATECAWAPDYRAWAFPMRNGLGHCIGIRLRSSSGYKFAVTGSRQGLFIPCVKPQPTAFIVEGPTSLAAALALGLFAIGEPSCNACINYTQVAINRLGIKRAVLVSDKDVPGLRGAANLANELQVPCCTLLLPADDLRDFVQLGGTKELIDSMIKSLIWKQPANHRT